MAENTTKEEDYIEWSLKALQNTYAFEYQGDNLLIARKNILKTYMDSYKEKLEKEPSNKTMDKAIEIITWNTWQMDLTTCTIPNTCKDKIIKKRTLFETEITTKPCPGCQKEDIRKHTGIYAKIYDWEKDEEILFLDLIKFKRKRR